MEGATLPWRVQKIEGNYPDIESMMKSLPPLPSGYEWERLNDGSWVLHRHITGLLSDSDIEIQTSNESIVIDHVIMPNDTLSGLCLRYRVTAVEIRRLNCFSGSNIKFKKVIRIPITHGVPFYVQEVSPDVIIQKFRNETDENIIEAQVYLEENKWDLLTAIKAWKEDNLWGKLHEKNMIENQVRNDIIPVDESVTVTPMDTKIVHTVKPKRIFFT